MSVRFVRLRIAGFKSFAEAASVEILPGLTGIVGPNGCGKSNVVEALRWAMGESSARTLRGGEMDDLIFAGTAGRPARNLAEVTITLEEATGIAPPPFHDQPELQIARRIERGAGSAYRVNGRDARARDVQTLFADLATGARSSAMVSQGRVAAIVAARPEERRSVLEEAAGITGLHARRHEAELKLRATEANLARAEDLRCQLAARLTALGAQAGEAGRYRQIAADLRAAEAGLLALLHARARLMAQQAGEAVASAGRRLAEAEQRARQADEAEAQCNEALAAPREAESQARTALERQRIAGEMLAEQAARAMQDAAEAAARFELSREEAGQAEARRLDASEALIRIKTDLDAAEASHAALPAQRQATEQALRAAQAGMADANARLSGASAAETEARNQAERNAREGEAAAALSARLRRHLDELHYEHEAALRTLPDDCEIATLQSARDAALSALEASVGAAEQAAEDRIQVAREADALLLAAAEFTRAAAALSQADRDAAEHARSLDEECRQLDGLRQAAAQALVPDAERQAAQDAAADCEHALAACREALSAAERSRGDAQQARVEAGLAETELRRRHQQAETAHGAARDAMSRLQGEHARLMREAEAAAGSVVPQAALTEQQDRLGQARDSLTAAQQALAEAEQARLDAEHASAQAARALIEAEAARAGLQAEVEGLSRAMLTDPHADPLISGPAWPSLADGLEVPAGLEPALAAILAEGLQAAIDESAPWHWRALPNLPMPTWPEGTIALSSLIEAPPALSRVLCHAGLIENPDDGDRWQSSLQAGQCLVTRAGALWRWDGLRAGGGAVAAGGAVAIAAMALAQRRRLREAAALLDAAAARTTSLLQAASDLDRVHASALAAATAARSLRDRAEQALEAQRERAAGLSAQAAAATSRLAAILAPRDHAAGLSAEAAQVLSDTARALAALPEISRLSEALDAAREHEAAQVASEAEATRRRQRAEAALQDAGLQTAALLSRHGAAQSRIEALLPQRARLAQQAALAAAQAESARQALDAWPLGDPAEQARARGLAASELAQAREIACRDSRQQAARQRDRAEIELAEAVSRQAGQRGRLEALAPRLDDARRDHDAAVARHRALCLEASGLPDPRQAEAACAAARQALAQAAEHEAGIRDARAQQQAAAASVQTTRDGLASARVEWLRREAGAREGDALARARLAADTGARDALAGAPERAALHAAEQATAQEQTTRAHLAASAALETATQAHLEALRTRRQADADLSEARQSALRAQDRAEQAQAVLAQLLAETPEPPTTVPHDLSEAAESGMRRLVARLLREREALGPVNLLADLEHAEAQASADAIGREHAELDAAIARLRGSIGHLNREGRERLLAVFQAVDRHFQALFARMFNGGRAHLGMVGDDDPLSAGLEIYAQPPGKKLATLSLLSGGEQALTALSLIFAVFRCNPAPICVLDEVDAPLDDANVGRFVALLADMVADTGTRFLVVTHHQLTMAHMDRLYGVTMQERGVSRLISVDLAAASGMVTSPLESA